MENWESMTGTRKYIAELEKNVRIKKQVGQCPFNKVPSRVTIHGLVEVCYRNLAITSRYNHAADQGLDVFLACERCNRPDWDQLFDGTLEKVGMAEIIQNDEYEAMKKNYE